MSTLFLAKTNHRIFLALSAWSVLPICDICWRWSYIGWPLLGCNSIFALPPSSKATWFFSTRHPDYFIGLGRFFSLNVPPSHPPSCFSVQQMHIFWMENVSPPNRLFCVTHAFRRKRMSGGKMNKKNPCYIESTDRFLVIIMMYLSWNIWLRILHIIYCISYIADHI